MSPFGLMARETRIMKSQTNNGHFMFCTVHIVSTNVQELDGNVTARNIRRR